MPLESNIIEIIEGRRKAPLVRCLLRGCSHGYGVFAALRNHLFEAGLFKSAKALPLVVSIGNIAAGGTGKTPLVIHLAKILSEATKVAVLSRGYRSQVETSGQTVTIDALSHLSPEFYGDEPYLIAKSVPESIVIVGTNRVASAQRAHLLGAKLLLLDDGMQYRKLTRDVEIVTLDAADPLGKGFYLPRGFLRDSPKRLKNADLLVVNFIQNKQQLQAVEKTLRRYSSSPIVAMRTTITNACDVAGKKVAAFCAIAKPERFFETVQHCQGELVDKMTAIDHGTFSERALREFSHKAKRAGATVIVCTEKDWVKLPDGLQLDLPLICLKTDLEIVSGREKWEEMLNKIYQKLKED